MWNFKGYLWNSTQNILPIHWKMQFLFNIQFLRALRACKHFWNSPLHQPSRWHFQQHNSTMLYVIIMSQKWPGNHFANSLWTQINQVDINFFCYNFYEMIPSGKEFANVMTAINIFTTLESLIQWDLSRAFINHLLQVEARTSVCWLVAFVVSSHYLNQFRIIVILSTFQDHAGKISV